MTKPAAPDPSWLWRSLALFLLIYTLLIIPWPGWDELYGSYFRGLAGLVFTREDAPEKIEFERHILAHDFSVLNTQMILRHTVETGDPPREMLIRIALDTRSIGWLPTALTAALILASPIRWSRKLGALVAGLVLVHLLILFTLETCIWSKSSAIGILNLSPFWQRVADGLYNAFVVQLGISFTLPVLIWLLVCFRKRDAALLFGRSSK